jgi:hypothetical protein
MLKMRAASNGGEPSSVTIAVTTLVLGICPLWASHENSPLVGFTVAPAGAPPAKP